MEAKAKRKIEDGAEYDALFPQASLRERTVKKGATVTDTVNFIPKVVRQTLWQTEKIADKLKGESLYETCRNIWEFVYHHIAYEKDDTGTEQIRSPARAWHDRFRGVDCDCYTTFISSILTNLKIPHVLRITKYRKDYYQHIYPIVPTVKGNYITLDCVVDRFDTEEPYSEKEDTEMDLQYLDGLAETNTSPLPKTVDAWDLFGTEMLLEEGLGKKSRSEKKEQHQQKKEQRKENHEQKKEHRQEKKAEHKTQHQQKKEAKHKDGHKPKLKDKLKKVMHVANRINPATVALRNGVLAAMKLNEFKIAQRLKWSYLSEEQARAKGMDMEKYKKLVAVRVKLEGIFFGAGGKPENLKSAILTGKGNKNHEVSGLLGYIPKYIPQGVDRRSSLKTILGQELWHSENMEGTEEIEGLGDLGVVGTAATLTVASGVLAAISALLKSIGNIFPNKGKGSDDFENTAKDDQAAEDAGKNLNTQKDIADMMDNGKSDDGGEGKPDSGTNTGGDGSAEGKSEDADNSGSGSLWNKHKKWLKPTLAIGGGLGLAITGYKLLTGAKAPAKPPLLPSPSPAPLSGLKSRKKGKRKAGKKTSKKTPIALL